MYISAERAKPNVFRCVGLGVVFVFVRVLIRLIVRVFVRVECFEIALLDKYQKMTLGPTGFLIDPLDT